MTTITLGVVGETAGNERRVALTPDGVTRLVAAGMAVVVESGAGQAAWYPDATYTAAGARVVNRDEIYAQADVLFCVRPPDDVTRMHVGQTLIGLLQPLTDPELAREARGGEGDRDQPGHAAAHAEPGTVDGRTHLSGERRRLQGGPGRRRRLRRATSRC